MPLVRHFHVWLLCELTDQFYEFALAVGQKDGATAVSVVSVFLLELKDFMRLRGFRILYDQWA